MLKEADIQTPDLGFMTSNHGWQLLVITDQNHMLQLMSTEKEINEQDVCG